MEVRSKSRTEILLRRKESYESKIREIDFLANNTSEKSEIFNLDTMECKLFLIKSFTALNANFHYLSLLGIDSVDENLTRAGGILQIYPYESAESNKTFSNMNDSEIHEFWMRFFYLCKIQNSILNSSLILNKMDEVKFISTFSMMSTALQYINYDMSLVNTKKVQDIDVNKEISSWTDVKWESINKSSNQHPVQCKDLIQKNRKNIDIINFSSNLNYIKNKIDMTVDKVNEPDDTNFNFYHNFINSVTKMDSFRNCFDILCSSSYDDVLKSTTVFEGSRMLLNNCQIKKCIDLFQNILSMKQNMC